MNWKRFASAFFVVFVLYAGGGFLIHGMLLHGDYAQFPKLLRTEAEAQAYMEWMALNWVLFAAAFVWVYAQGVEDKPRLGQGLRYGLAMWVLTSLSVYLIFYAVQPWSAGVVAKQIGYELGHRLVLGLAVAALYKK